jgi:hypothetical protein
LALKGVVNSQLKFVTPSNDFIGGWLGLTAGMDEAAKRKAFAPDRN